jgi:hypothetical protein
MENTSKIGQVEGGEGRGTVAVAKGEKFDAGGAESGKNIN